MSSWLNDLSGRTREQQIPPDKPEMNPGAPEWYAGPDSLMASVMLLLNDANIIKNTWNI